MRVIFCGLLGAALLSAQVSTTSIRPAAVAGNAPGVASARTTRETRKAAIAAPTLGFLMDSSGTGLVPIDGTPESAALGEEIPKPEGVSRIYLPPRQHYALVEENQTQTMAVWHLARRHVAAGHEVLDAVAGASGHPDSVAFSPKGTAAALYFSASRSVQVVTGLPGKPVVQPAIAVTAASEPKIFALSDDGQVLAAVDGNGQLELATPATSSQMQATSFVFAPLAMNFVAGTHDLAVSDAQQKQLLLLRQVDAPVSAPAVIGSGLQPDSLASTSDGAAMIALDTAHQNLWQIDAKKLSIAPIGSANVPATLATLRDGHTFLVSTAPLTIVTSK